MTCHPLSSSSFFQECLYVGKSLERRGRTSRESCQPTFGSHLDSHAVVKTFVLSVLPHPSFCRAWHLLIIYTQLSLFLSVIQVNVTKYDLMKTDKSAKWVMRWIKWWWRWSVSLLISWERFCMTRTSKKWPQYLMILHRWCQLFMGWRDDLRCVGLFSSRFLLFALLFSKSLPSSSFRKPRPTIKTNCRNHETEDEQEEMTRSSLRLTLWSSCSWRVARICVLNRESTAMKEMLEREEGENHHLF